MNSYVLVVLVLTLIILMLFREFWCWYFKLNRIVSLLKEINELQQSAPATLALGASALAIGDSVQLLSDRPPSYGQMVWEEEDDPLLGKVGQIIEFDADGTFRLDIDPRGGWFAPRWVARVSVKRAAGNRDAGV